MRKRTGFYEQRRRGCVLAGSDEDEFRRRLREAVYRTPGEKRLLMQAMRALGGGKVSEAQKTADRVKAVLDLLGEQLLPGDGTGI